MSPKKLTRLGVAVTALVAALAVQGIGHAAPSGVGPALNGTATAAQGSLKVVRLPRPINLSVPAFKVEAVKLYAADESGYDWAGSDEPMLTFTSAIGNGDPYTVATPEFGDVDSGDTRSLNNLCLLASCTTGFTEPTALSMQLFEMDSGSPEEVRKWVERAAEGVEWGTLAYSGEKIEVPDWLIDYFVGLIGNDLLGSQTLRLDPQELRQRLPRVGDSLTESHHLGGNDGDLPWSVAGGPDYDVHLRITRLADKPIVKAPVASGVAQAAAR
jgi:hypothetical protein